MNCHHHRDLILTGGGMDGDPGGDVMGGVPGLAPAEPVPQPKMPVAPKPIIIPKV